MSKPSIASYMASLEEDDLRIENPFSDDMLRAHEGLFASGADETARIAVFRSWLRKYQPCLFGRLAATHDLITFCILDSSLLSSTDQAIQDRIQAARTDWKREAFDGRKSAFMILAVDPLLASARPTSTVRNVAIRLAELYLLKEIRADEIYLDDLLLEVPGSGRNRAFKWDVGANYFAAHGDGRWWHDHRIPGGIALSMNSVGHLAKATRLADAMGRLDRAVGVTEEERRLGKVDSLLRALELAMDTISLAAPACSGPATRLLAAESDSRWPEMPPVPTGLPERLRGKSHCEYAGLYHTDVTIPSEYFSESISRPAGLQEHLLDFTYLHEAALENPDYLRVGEGIRVREGDSLGGLSGRSVRMDKRKKAAESEVELREKPPYLD